MAPTATEDSPARRVRFVLDGKVVELDDVDPTRTVLQFLREDLQRTGTKEGCAEGDCGACTVVLAELDASGESLRVRAINSCIRLLPTLDGKELITVESLRGGGALHPVQKAMVDCHGSQCGFCTPGFVMSLFALYKNSDRPTRVDIDDALAGNLCRCTGYRPIVDAARRMYDEAANRDAAGDWLLTPKGRESDAADHEKIALLGSIQPVSSLSLRHGERSFHAPRTVAELADLVSRHPDATLLAGGTDVGLWVTKQHRNLDTVIYTGSVADLHTVTAAETHIEIGAAATLTDVIPVLTAHYPELHELFIRFASPPIRNAGTLGGNIANGSPIGDSMPALMVLDASLILRSGERTRELPLHEFYIAYQETALERGEFLERIRVPLPDGDSRVGSYKVSKRFDQDISAVCGAYRVRLIDGFVADARVAYGGMAATPKRARSCERALTGRPFDAAATDAAMQALASDFEPISDMRASAGYRMTVCQNLLRRFHLECTGESPARVYDYGRA